MPNQCFEQFSKSFLARAVNLDLTCRKQTLSHSLLLKTLEERPQTKFVLDKTPMPRNVCCNSTCSPRFHAPNNEARKKRHIRVGLQPHVRADPNSRITLSKCSIGACRFFFPFDTVSRELRLCMCGFRGTGFSSWGVSRIQCVIN